MAQPAGRTVFMCSCEDTIPLDQVALARACKGARVEGARQLCRAELARFEAALGHGDVTVACTQEAPLFAERAEDAGNTFRLDTVNIREHAGWSREAKRATPKIAALLAGAAEPMPATPIVSYRSEGVTLVYGRDETAIEAARQLADRLNLTVLLTKPRDITPPATTTFPVVKGTIARARGHLGAFELTVNDYALPAPSSRARLEFGPARDGATSRCDVILDLSGSTPLFTAPHKRPGYLRADPNDPLSVQKSIFKAADLVGTFDKPRFITFTDSLCAHSRSRKTGCTRCLDLCPVGAIAPAGDHVAIDTMICAGCGSCAAVCPTGAAAYALPPSDALLRKLRAVLLAYAEAEGRRAVLLVHEGEHGLPLLDALARFGDGLPARVIPFQVNEVTALGIETVAAAFAYGAAELRVLLGTRHRDDLAALDRTLALADAVLQGWGFGPDRAAMLRADDPDTLAIALAALPDRDGAAPRSFLPMGDKRGVMQIALNELHKAAPAPAEIVPLPEKAPFGTVHVNVAPEAAAPRVIKEEEPFACIRCGKPFGVKSTVERVAAKLAASHWMYKGSAANLDLIRMCEDCRVIAVTEGEGIDPYAGPPRPRIVTSEDYKKEGGEGA
jgi:ferredoxin